LYYNHLNVNNIQLLKGTQLTTFAPGGTIAMAEQHSCAEDDTEYQPKDSAAALLFRKKGREDYAESRLHSALAGVESLKRNLRTLEYEGEMNKAQLKQALIGHRDYIKQQNDTIAHLNFYIEHRECFIIPLYFLLKVEILTVPSIEIEY